MARESKESLRHGEVFAAEAKTVRTVLAFLQSSCRVDGQTALPGYELGWLEVWATRIHRIPCHRLSWGLQLLLTIN